MHYEIVQQTAVGISPPVPLVRSPILVGPAGHYLSVSKGLTALNIDEGLRLSFTPSSGIRVLETFYFLRRKSMFSSAKDRKLREELMGLIEEAGKIVTGADISSPKETGKNLARLAEITARAEELNEEFRMETARISAEIDQLGAMKGDLGKMSKYLEGLR